MEIKKEKNNEVNIAVEKFARHITPLNTESNEKNDDKMVKWGELDNLYPNFLIDLADKSAIHGSILETKGNYIFGDGVIDKKSTEYIGDDITVNADGLSLSDLMRSIINDMVYFNSFAIKVEFNVLGEPMYYTPIPVHHVRMNKSKTKVFVNSDWFKNPRTYLSYDKYNPKVQYEDTNAKVFYYSSYRVSVNNVYPKPDYHNGIESSVIDSLITEFFKNNIANGFSLTKIMHVIGTMPDAETKKRTTNQFREVFTGVSGDGFIMDYATDKDRLTSVDTIPADDYASKLIEVIKKAERNILASHNASSSILFGIEKEGSLGNASELENAYQLYKNNYVKEKRLEIVGAINRLFVNDDRYPTIDLKDKENLFKSELDSATRQRVLTINELRQIDGKEPIEGGDKFLEAIQPAESPKVGFSKKKDDEELIEATLEDFEKLQHLGTSKSDFITLSSAQFTACGEYHFSTVYGSIEEYLLNNKIVGLTIDEIASKISNELGYTVSKSDVQSALDLLKNTGLIESKINTKTGILHTAPADIVGGSKVEVYYDYVKRAEAEGSTIIPTSRHFCTSVVNSDKYFSAMDIQNFSSILGYDVMKYGGGFWRNKNTGVTNKHCRHEWKPVKVIKK